MAVTSTEGQPADPLTVTPGIDPAHSPAHARHVRDAAAAPADPLNVLHATNRRTNAEVARDLRRNSRDHQLAKEGAKPPPSSPAGKAISTPPSC